METNYSSDNNTRVLFERILTSGSLTAENSLEIWNKFLEFESSVGDLSSVLKVEKRRNAVLDKVKEMDSHETALIIDRYRFANLYPCSPADLRALGYDEVEELGQTTKKSWLKESILAAKPKEAEFETTLFKPDFSQMVPFKPKIQWIPGEHVAPGGSFPIPPAAAQLNGGLPPPNCFQGPYVAVDMLMEVLKHMHIPEPGGAPVEPAENLHLFDLARSVHWVSKDGQSGDGPRRKRPIAEEADDEEGMGTHGGPPPNDIYRRRQQKRVN